MTARPPRTTASRIIAEICNRRRNSDVRADDLEVRFELDKAFDAEREVSRKLAEALREAIDVIGDAEWNGEAKCRAALAQYTGAGTSTEEGE